MGDEETKKPIEPPVLDKKRQLTRAAAEIVAGLFPGGSELARFYQVAFPPKAEQDQAEWQETISSRTNEHGEQLAQHDQILRPSQTISGLPAEIITWFIKGCPDGLGMQYIENSEVQSAFPVAPADDIDEAVAELRLVGLLNVQHHFGGWHASLTSKAYEQLDAQIMDWKPLEDAIVVAKQILEQKSGTAQKLHELTGWPRRRFNPAFQYLLRFFPDDRVGQWVQAEYPAPWVMVEPEDRVRLRRFIQSNEDVAK